jgi:hypothetical protein
LQNAASFPDLDMDTVIQALQIAGGAIVVLESLRTELHEIGQHTAKTQRERGISMHDGIMAAMPDNCRIMGAVWHEIERGFREAWSTEPC